MLKLYGYLFLCAFALAFPACALPQTAGTMHLPDGTPVQYVAQTVESSAFNSSVIVATKAPAGVNVKVQQGTGAANAVMDLATGVANGMGFFIPFCAAGNC